MLNGSIVTAENSTSSATQVLPAGWRDLGTLQEIERICFPKDYWPIWDLIGILSFPGIIRLKAVVDRQMVGFIASEYKFQDEAHWIATVAVLPKYQRLGLGNALLRACEERMQHDTVRLCVRKSNYPAQHLYKHAGYEITRIWPNYYTDGENALVMEKRLR